MADKDKAGNPNTYAIKPHFRKKFQPMKVEEIIKTELREKLENEKYHVDKAAKQAREITDSIKKRLKELGWDRYKYVVQVIVGEQRGEGIKSETSCFGMRIQITYITYGERGEEFIDNQQIWNTMFLG